MRSAELAEELSRKWGLRALSKPLVVGLGGLPYAGKTSLANYLVDDILSGDGCTIPLESFIDSREARHLSGIDGCDPAAYDFKGVASCLASLLSEGDVFLPRYSWALGRQTDLIDKYRCSRSGVIFLDGTVTIHPKLAVLCDRRVFFVTCDKGEWLREAIHRDVHERNWSRETAATENLRKWDTSLELLRANARAVTDLIQFEVDSSETFDYSAVTEAL